MVFVTVSETYDLSTKTDKMSMIGIHTPKREIIQKHYPGLLMNCKYLRIVKQDVVLACASMLPADPLQVGVASGKIAPQDMFNPILYKAVSNDSFSTLEARLAGLARESGLAIDGQSAIITNDKVTGINSGVDEFNVYYALLANHEGFKKAHPQQGLQMKGLVPLVFEKYYNYGENSQTSTTWSGAESADAVFPALGADANKGLAPVNRTAHSMRGRPHAMPKFNTTYITGADATGESRGNNYQSNGMAGGAPDNFQIQNPDPLPCYTAVVIMPPCKLNQLFYRMTVRTTLEFTGIRPMQEITSFKQMASSLAPVTYFTDYTIQSKSMSQSLGMVDAKDAEIEKIMEGA